MRLFEGIVSTLVLSCCVSAQQDLYERLPGCAVQCFEAALPTSRCMSGNSTHDAASKACLCADIDFQATIAACNAANCTVVEMLKATNETRAECGIPVRDASGTMIGVTASIGSLAEVMVVVRLAYRAVSRDGRLGWDDFLIAISGIFSLFQNVTVYIAGALGFGRDIWGIEPDNLTLSLKYLYVTYFAYQLVEMFCQLSILAFYLRLVTSKPTKILIYILFVAVTMFGLGNTFSMVFQCKPIALFWDGWRGDMKGACTVDVRLFGFIRGGIEIVLDLIILTLPLPMLLKLQMEPKKKMQIISVFCVGFIITIVSCLRLWSLVRFDQSTNPTYDNVSGVYWCLTEANLFIVVACMPAMRPIVQRIAPKMFGSIQQSGYLNSSSGYVTRPQNSSIPFGVIHKSMDIKVQRDTRADSDVHLVERNTYEIVRLPSKTSDDTESRST